MQQLLHYYITLRYNHDFALYYTQFLHSLLSTHSIKIKSFCTHSFFFLQISFSLTHKHRHLERHITQARAHTYAQNRHTDTERHTHRQRDSSFYRLLLLYIVMPTLSVYSACLDVSKYHFFFFITLTFAQNLNHHACPY